jgi:hypothetical protein
LDSCLFFWAEILASASASRRGRSALLGNFYCQNCIQKNTVDLNFQFAKFEGVSIQIETTVGTSSIRGPLLHCHLYSVISQWRYQSAQSNP